MRGFDEAVEAAKAGDLETVRELVEANPALLNHRDDEQHSLFDRATWALLVDDLCRQPTIAPDEDGSRMGIVQLLLDAGADPNGPSQDGWTPLHTALYENHVALTKLLLERNASPRTEVYGDGGTPLLQALFWGHREAAAMLSRHDVSPSNLRVAAGLGRLDLVEAAFTEEGELTEAACADRSYYRPHADFPEWTPSNERQEILDEALTYAARSGRDLPVLEALVERGANVDGGPYNGASLHWAASAGHVDTCRWLLDQGADPNVRAVYGSQAGVTPLHCAAWADQLDVARLLLERGADHTLRDTTYDSTPQGWAEYMKSEQVQALLTTYQSGSGATQ